MRRTYRYAGLILLACMLLVLGACTSTGSSSGSTSGGSSSGKTITLNNLSFEPSTLTVAVGDTVTIDNKDAVPHHIVIGNDDLGEQAPGKTTTWKAPADGVYIMKCVIHSTMSGQITVGAGGATVGTPPASGGTGGY